MSSVPHGHEFESAAPLADQIAVDGSVGSDTDREGSTKVDSANKDGAGSQLHARSNSVKKPITFKAVSVTRNFLAKAGTPTPPSLKVNGENVPSPANSGSATPPAPRPRLVAKSASGTKQAKSQLGPQAGSGPDPMQVWNRNRGLALPPQPSKHLTDEELKQQYGIHLATRIQADADGNEAKWADIDDDDEDWAPDTIEWNDGTKIDLTQNDQAALLAEKEAAEEVERRLREEEERKAKRAQALAESKPATSVGPNATILKPRSTVQSKPGTPVVLSKAPNDSKPSLVSKPSTNTPAKSPWAPLPAVDKYPPVDIRPEYGSGSSGPMRAQQAIAQSMQDFQGPTHPAMEIAADSFKRGRNEAQRDNVGQLFNAQSGHFEPASGGRRSSMRKDGNFRPPSLLQRGGAAHAVEGGATNQSRNDQSYYDRRKSSTVSGDSGRRYSLSKGSDVPFERDGSQYSQAVRSPSPSIVSPSLANAQIAQDGRASASLYQVRQGQGSLPPASAQDDYQKQLMKEKIEQARRRRAEEEKRESTERQERIRKKMEQFALDAPEKKDEEVEEDTKADADAKMAQSKPVDSARGLASKGAGFDEASVTAPEVTLPNPKSPPKPPAPNASGIPQQYGMMKLHGTVTREPHSHLHHADQIRATLEAEKHRLAQHDHAKTSVLGVHSKLESDKRLSSPLVNGVGQTSSADLHFPRSPELHVQQASREPRQTPWNDTTKDSTLHANWTSQASAKESSGVWGHSSSGRALGNGTFDPTIQRPQSRHQDQQASPALAPIGTPKHLQQPKDHRDQLKSKSASSIDFEDLQAVPSYPPLDMARLSGENRLASPSDFLASAHTISQKWENSKNASNRDRTQATLAAWNNFSVTAAQEEEEERRKWRQDYEKRLAEEARTGVKFEPQLPKMNETWRQIKVDENLGRVVVSTTKSSAQSPNISSTGTREIRSMPFVGSADVSPSISASVARASRFFPVAGRLHPFQQQSAAPFSPFYRRGDSPPPPDESGHPVFGKQAPQVVVRLPPESMRPKVRLPPSLLAPVSPSSPEPLIQLPLRAASQPLVNNPSWQDRFDGLLGLKKASPDRPNEPKPKPVLGFSATKEPLDLPVPRVQASVALPPHARSKATLDTHLQATSKDPHGEEAIFEPESGSTPTVMFPRFTASSKAPLKQRTQLSPSFEVISITKDTLQIPDIITAQNLLLVFINLLGMNSSKSKQMRLPNGYEKPREQQPGLTTVQQTTPPAKSRPIGRIHKTRDSGSYGNQHAVKSSNVSPANKAAGRGGLRASSDRSSAPRGAH